MIPEVWKDRVLPLVEQWATSNHHHIDREDDPDGGRLSIEGTPARMVAWVFADLSEEFTPSFKLFVDDLEADERGDLQAQIFLSTTTRKVRLGDGS